MARNFLIVLLLLFVGGCQSLIERSQSQARMLTWRIRRTADRFHGSFSRDEPSFGEPSSRSTDLRERFSTAAILGSVRRGRVTVSYASPGQRELAERTAAFGARLYRLVDARFGLPWRYDTHLLLVPVDRMPEAFHFAVHGEVAVWPLLVPDSTRSMVDVFERNLFPYTWAHELTEASLTHGHPRPVLNDSLFRFPFFDIPYVNGTRWFRDGLSNYVGFVALEELAGETGVELPLPHSRPLENLEGLGDRLVDWSQFQRGPSTAQYAAALGLFLELSTRFGDGIFARILRRARARAHVDGDALIKAVLRETGWDLRSLERYRAPGLGLVVHPLLVPGFASEPTDRRSGPHESVATVSVDVRPALEVRIPSGRSFFSPKDLILRVAGRPATPLIMLRERLRARHERRRLPLDVRTWDGREKHLRIWLDRKANSRAE